MEGWPEVSENRSRSKETMLRILIFTLRVVRSHGAILGKRTQSWYLYLEDPHSGQPLENGESRTRSYIGNSVKRSQVAWPWGAESGEGEKTDSRDAKEGTPSCAWCIYSWEGWERVAARIGAGVWLSWTDAAGPRSRTTGKEELGGRGRPWVQYWTYRWVWRHTASVWLDMFPRKWQTDVIHKLHTTWPQRRVFSFFFF